MILEEIPLIEDAADQTADIVLNNLPLTIRVVWNERFQYWSLSLFERGGEPLVLGVKMVTDFPLIGKFRNVPVEGELYFLHRGGRKGRPTFEDLQRNIALIYYNPESPGEFPVPLAPMV